jgi:predicted small lipoprotein YifL
VNTPLQSFFLAFLAISAVSSVVGCGKKGPPLAPLIKLPVAPADLAAARRGDAVDLSFTVPSVNTDGTRPANVAHAEVYAITAAATVPPLSDASVLKYGTKVGSVEVKAPRDPNLTADEDDASDEVDAPEGVGLDQGAPARVTESLTRDMSRLVEVPRDKNLPPLPKQTIIDGPLLGPPPTIALRTYAAFGTSTRGKKGPLSRRVTIPLVPPPPVPSGAAITYDETAIQLTWSPASIGGVAAAADGDLLFARPLGAASPAITYNVYDATTPEAAVRLTKTPLDVAKFTDSRMVWGEKRCYVILATQTIAGATIESDAPPATCKTLVDTFPPSAPKDIKAIASEGVINLIWEPNAEKDLAGYIVLRGVEPAQTLAAITPESAPIVETSFKDTVTPGIAYVYAVIAVDKAGNKGPASVRVVETAR